MDKSTPPNLDDLAAKILGAMPGGIQDFKNDVEKNIHASLRIALGKLNLVTREEFDVQQAVLSRTRAKLDELERQIAELEKKLGEKK